MIKQRKYKVLPLVSFYIAATLNVILHMVYSTYFFSIVPNYIFMSLLFLLGTKMMIGID